MELTGLSLSVAARQIHLGALSPIELTQAYMERIERLNPGLNCYLTLTPELALSQAGQAEAIWQAWLTDDRIPAMGNLPPLLGIPLALKDLFETAGVRTTAGSKFFQDYIAMQDAAVVSLLKQAGAIMLGKLNMHEIALGVTNDNPHFGPCRNPWNRERIPGGSSGGSAAALAAHLCLGSLGSDTGGSIRIPASLCGIVGLKPTYGRVSLRGVIPLSWNLDHVGPMAREVRDVAILLGEIAGYDSLDPASLNVPIENYLSHLEKGVRGWRIALAADNYFTNIDPQVVDAVHTAAQVFRQLGAHVEEVPFPHAWEAAQANGQMTACDAAAFHHQRLISQPASFGEDVRRRLLFGAEITSTEYCQARRTQVVLRREFEQFFQNYDLLLTPTTPIPAPLIEGPDAVEQARLLTRFTAPFNLTGLPALSLPCGFTTQDSDPLQGSVPIGLQLIARPWHEVAILQAAFAYEQATPWHTYIPDL